MGMGTGHTTVSAADKWIPELWQDEVVATYMAKTVMRNLVDVNQHEKHKGDVIHIPNPGRGEASAKGPSTQVSFIEDNASEITISINKHYEYSKLYEDIADILALNGMKKFYTKDAGYALAKRVDGELHKLMASMQGGSISSSTLYETGVIGGDGATTFSGSANSNTGNGTALTDVGIRAAMQLLEDQDVNTAECALVVPPTVMKTLRGISRFTEQAFVGDGNAIKTGRIGNLYGLEVFSSSLCPWIHVNSATGTQAVRIWRTNGTTPVPPSTAPTGSAFVDDFGITTNWSSGTDTKYRVCSMFHRDAMALYEAQSITTEQQRKVEYLGYAVVSSTIFGVGVLRNYAGVSIVVPA